eukprot:141438_1
MKVVIGFVLNRETFISEDSFSQVYTHPANIMSPVLPVKIHSFTFSSRYVTRLLLLLLIAFVLFSVGKGQNCGGTPTLNCPMTATYSVNLYESLVIPAGDINASTTGVS